MTPGGREVDDRPRPRRSPWLGPGMVRSSSGQPDWETAGDGFAFAGDGYEADAMNVPVTSELRLPADPDYIVVAKRAAAGFACVAGFDVEACDDLVIAVAQACENAIAAANGRGELRLTFRIGERGLEVRVRSTTRPVPVSQSNSQSDASASVRSPAAGVVPQPSTGGWMREAFDQAAAVHELALRVMGLFVDDCHYRIDQRTGGLRVRLTKYRVS